MFYLILIFSQMVHSYTVDFGMRFCTWDFVQSGSKKETLISLFSFLFLHFYFFISIS